MGSPLKIIVAGQRSFAVAVLERVISDGHEVAAVWTNEGDPLEIAAHAEDLPALIEPRAADVGDLDADLVVCAHLHAYLPSWFRELTRLGAIGYHPSLLPRHRGKDAIRWTIAMRDPIAGGSIYWMDDGYDTGPIARQDWCHVRQDDDASSLWRRELFPMGVRLLREELSAIHRGWDTKTPQDETVATYEPPWQDQPEVADG